MTFLEKTQALAIILEERAYAYDILRRVFLEEPTKDLLQALVSEEIFKNFPFGNENSMLTEGAKEADSYLEENNPLEEKEFNKLHWDYTKMFIGPYKLPAPPWESAYMTEEKLLFQEKTLEVRKKYLKYNFVPKYFLQEADDHVGLELDFMYRISLMALEKYNSKAIEEVVEILNDQAIFLEEHLLKWIPVFTKNIVENAHTSFYLGAAKVLKAYLELDYQALSELQKELAS